MILKAALVRSEVKLNEFVFRSLPTFQNNVLILNRNIKMTTF